MSRRKTRRHRQRQSKDRSAGRPCERNDNRTEQNLELLVLAMGAGSLILSHVNDSGFWFVKEYFGMTVTETLKTWTVIETGIAVSALVLILIADMILRLV